MPFKTSAGPRHRGWFYDQVVNRLVLAFNGTEVLDFDANDIAIAQNTQFAGTLGSTGLLTATAGATVTTGNLTVAAGDERITAGNLRLGVVSAFAMTEPTSAVVMKAGTAPAGAITTSGGIFASSTVVQKIIAAGTVSNVET